MAATASLGRWSPLGVALLLLACPLTPALADAYVVAPVSMTLSADNPLGEFRLSNRDTHAIRVQVDVRLWSQDGNGSVESPTRDFIVSPRFAEIPAGGTQLVRVALRHPMPSATEQSYRVLFREIPSLSMDRDKEPVVLNYSVPLFVAADDASDPQLSWSVERSDPGTLLVTVNNTGGRHAKLKFYSMSTGSDLLPLPDEVARPHYVLPGAGAQMRVALPSPTTYGNSVHLSIDVDGKRRDLSLPFK